MKIKSMFVQVMLRLFGARMFNSMLLQIENSATYGRFCELVYGRNLWQANMVDEVQLRKLISLVDLKVGDRVLDLGCGSGGLTEYLSDLSGARVLGVDFASKAIARAQRRTLAKLERIQFQTQNLNSLSLQHKTFDCVISVDTLYFVKDLTRALQQLKAALKPNGKLLIFYSSKLKQGALRTESHFRETDLAKVLSGLGFEFEAWDFTQNEKEIWEKSLLVAEQLKESFLKEGSRDLYNGRVKEAEQNIKWQNEGCMVRYLYMATLK